MRRSLRDDATPPAEAALVDVLALDAALDELSALDTRLSQVVELKFFAGLSIDETAQALKVSIPTNPRLPSIARSAQVKASAACIRKRGSGYLGWVDTQGQYEKQARRLADGTILPVSL